MLLTSHTGHIERRLAWLAALDVGCLCAGMLLAAAVRIGSGQMGMYLAKQTVGWFHFAAAIFVSNYITGSYGMELRLSRFDMLVNWAFSLCMALLVVSVTSYAWLDLALGRGVLALAIAIYSALWLPLRLVVYHFVLRRERFTLRVVVLGAGETAHQAIRMIETPAIRPRHRVVARVALPTDDLSARPTDQECGLSILRITPGQLVDSIRALAADVLVVAPESPGKFAQIYPELRRLRFEGLVVMSAGQVAETYAGRVAMEYLDEEELMRLAMLSSVPAILRFKRVMDVFLSVLALLVAAPLMMVVALAIKVSSPRDPVFYSQDRVGRFGEIFRIHKFRTMRSDAEQETGPVWSAPDDARVTRLGRWLRRMRLDELPQLINILGGDMSMVGPRPERPELVAELGKEIPYYRERENVLPGLTGWAQIRHPYGRSIEDARRKLEYDLYYIKHLSPGLDLRIILRTLRIVFLGLEHQTR